MQGLPSIHAPGPGWVLSPFSSWWLAYVSPQTAQCPCGPIGAGQDCICALACRCPPREGHTDFLVRISSFFPSAEGTVTSQPRIRAAGQEVLKALGTDKSVLLFFSHPSTSSSNPLPPTERGCVCRTAGAIMSEMDLKTVQRLATSPEKPSLPTSLGGLQVLGVSPITLYCHYQWVAESPVPL